MIDLDGRVASSKDKELKVMKSRVLAAAEKCPTAKEALRGIFPDAFRVEDEWEPVDDFQFEYAKWATYQFARFNHSDGRGVILLYPNGTWAEGGCEIKIENGRVWRKRV